MSAVQIIVGCIFAFLGTCALTANSYLLGSGAIRWAHQDDVFEQAALAVGGGLVPWILALLPMLLALVVIDRGFVTRWGQRGLVLLLWALFFAYNFSMGASNLSKLREDTVASADHSRDAVEDARASRVRKIVQLQQIPTHRPPEAVSALLDAKRNHPRWKSSDECRDATAKSSRAFCDEYKALESEMRNGQTASRLAAEVDELDARIAAAPPTATASSDPFVERVHRWTAWDKEDIRVMQSMATPVALEVAGAFCWKVAFLLFGWSLHRVGEPRSVGAEGDLPPVQLYSPEAINARPVASLAALTRARHLAEWFFRECARPAPGGSLLEREWYEQYAEICRRHNDVPVPLENFRRIAAGCSGIIIQSIDGETHYQGYLPFVPTTQPA